MIGVVNYGMGNLKSVQNALNYLGVPSAIVNQPSELQKYSKLILPGVGAFGVAMKNLETTGLREALLECALEKRVPLLGICLGMQLLLESSTEHGRHCGLALIKGTVDYFEKRISDLPVPHMGWNAVVPRGDSPLFADIDPDAMVFYFVHNLYCAVDDGRYCIGTTEYGIHFDAVVQRENVFGCQFHPEKSQRSGLQLLKNFCAL